MTCDGKLTFTASVCLPVNRLIPNINTRMAMQRFQHTCCHTAGHLSRFPSAAMLIPAKAGAFVYF